MGVMAICDSSNERLLKSIIKDEQVHFETTYMDLGASEKDLYVFYICEDILFFPSKLTIKTPTGLSSSSLIINGRMIKEIPKIEPDCSHNIDLNIKDGISNSLSLCIKGKERRQKFDIRITGYAIKSS